MIVHYLREFQSVLWGIPLIATLVGTGIYFTVRLHFLQLFKLKLALGYLYKRHPKDDESVGDVSSFASLCTALSATIGTGNIVGVSTAILTGGPGALFWMWVIAFFGMATKYAEGVLAIRYRQKNCQGTMDGGPMYYLQNGLHCPLLAKLFAIFCIIDAMVGSGTFCQANSIAVSTRFFGLGPGITAILLVILVGIVTLGGIRSIAKVSEKIVPFMTSCYVLCAAYVLLRHAPLLPSMLRSIFVEAFCPRAFLGGGIGITLMEVIRIGVCRGIYCDESGLGSTPIAAATAKTHSAEKQGLVSMTGTFFSMLTCSMTGLIVILLFNSSSSIPNHLEGANLTSFALGSGLGSLSLGSYIVNISILLFAFTTILGWNFYGEKCFQYLFGERHLLIYKFLFLAVLAVGPFLSLEIIFIIADIANGLMAIPNLIGLLFLSKEVLERNKE